jgi:hypothetical protein
MTLSDAVELIEREKSAIERDGGTKHLIAATRDDGIEPKQVFSTAFEQEHRVSISEVCQKFANEGRWQVLRPSQQILVYERLKAARELLWTLENADVIFGRSHLQIDPEADRSEVLAFLLVHYWGMLAVERWSLKYL